MRRADKQREKLAVYMVKRILGLRKRRADGRFKYVKRGSREIVFEWDGAGLNKDGSIVLIEAELTDPLDWHIQCHLSRIAVMIGHGDRIKKLVWLVYPSKYRKLKSIVDLWLNYFLNICNMQFPAVEYMAPNEKILWKEA